MKSFSSSALHPEIIKALAEKEILIPTEIQAKTIPLLLEHKGDFAGRAATGTGKTYAFGAPLLSRIDTATGNTQAVILVPNRELCEQVSRELSDLGKYIEGLKIKAVYGGTALKAQINELSNGVQIIVATPGRLLDLIERKVVKLAALNFVVLDEADELLLKGFQADIDKVLSTANGAYFTWLFSATIPDAIHIIIKKHLQNNLKKVFVGEQEKTNKGIEHQVIIVKDVDKLNVLLHFLTRFNAQKGIIFCRTKSGVQKLYKQLSTNKFTCGAIHGNLPQNLRTRTMEQFKDGHLALLIATDVASRGIDVPDISFVIQYHPADTKDAYTHRSGRTSRAGKTGVSLTFLFAEERESFSFIEEELNLHLEYLSLPSRKDQQINKAILWAKKVAKTKPLSASLSEKSKQEFKNELKHLSKEELLERLLANYLKD